MNNNQANVSQDRLARLMRLLQVDPTNESLRRQCVDAAAVCERFDVVIELADSALAADPAGPAALFDRATGLIGLRDYRAAIAVLREVENIAGADAAIQMNAGLCHYCLGEYQQAKVRLDQSYLDGMRSPGLLRLLVSSYHHLGLTEEAVKIAQDNEEAGKGDGALAGTYAILFLDADDAVSASRWAKTTLRLNPRSVDGRVTEATLLTARMQTDQAQRMLEGVLQDAPETARAWIGLGTLALLGRQMDRAKEYLSRGVELMPGHVGSWHVLGWAQLMSGEVDVAHGSFQRALELDRNFSESHGSLAAIAAMRGEREHARQLLEVALRLDQECLSAKYAEAVLAGQVGNSAQSQKIILDTVSQLPGKHNNALAKLLLKATTH